MRVAGRLRTKKGMKRTGWAVFMVLAYIPSLWSVAFADVPEEQKQEVEHLLEFIRTSPCVFVRNGREYQGDWAHRHVTRKYAYFRDRITSTEEFIELSASESSISGEPYWFVCDGKPRQVSQEVLLGELESYRRENE